MSYIFLRGFAVTLALLICISTSFSQHTPETTTITGNYFDSAMIEAAISRINSLKPTAGFQTAKFVKFNNNDYLHDNYFQFFLHLNTMLNLPGSFNRQALLDATKRSRCRKK